MPPSFMSIVLRSKTIQDTNDIYEGLHTTKAASSLYCNRLLKIRELIWYKNSYSQQTHMHVHVLIEAAGVYMQENQLVHGNF